MMMQVGWRLTTRLRTGPARPYLASMKDDRLREGTIAEVGLDPEQRVFVRPTLGDFEHVYRAAMEVYWDKSSRRLSHPLAPRGFTPVQWFQQIVAAVADEYGVQLKLTKQTTWTAVPEDTRLAIEASA